MNTKKAVTATLATGMLAYIFACLWYMFWTRGFGTKFHDSLSDEQKEIKRKSYEERKHVFVTGSVIGLLFSIVVVYLLNK